jgi:hypothetical protein
MAMSHLPIAVLAPFDPRGVRMASALVALALVAGSPAGAQESGQGYPARQIGDWTVAASKDQKGCFLTRDYDGAGKTTLLLGLDGDGINHLSVLNANWSIKPKDQLTLTFRLSGGGYDDHGAVGMAADGKQGFVTSFEAKFPGYFAASKALNIFRDDVPVAQLSLAGSGAAVAALRTCVSVRGAAAPAGARAKRRVDGIPTDPFAPGLARKSRR